MVLALRIVSNVVRGRSNVDAAHIESLITRFLLPSPNMSLTDAIQFNSLELLDWIWDASCTSVDARSPTWTLTNYLRSDPHYYRWQFAEAMKVAVQRADLQVVKWLFAHFSWCVVPIAAVELAAAKGDLDILKFLRVETATVMDLNIHRDKQAPTHGEGDIGVEWYSNNSTIRCALGKGHIDIAWWLYEGAPYNNSKTLNEIAKYYLRIGDIEKADSALPNREKMFQLVVVCSNPQAIEAGMDRGYYTQREERAAGRALRVLAREGRVDLLQRMVELYPGPPLHAYYWGEEWSSAVEEACRSGKLFALQFLMNHPNGRRICENVRRVSDLICFAGRNGDLEMMEFIYGQILAARALRIALRKSPKVDMRYAVATGGHVNVLEWYVERFPATVQHSAERIISTASRYGQLDILRKLHYLDVLSRLQTCSSSSNINEKTDMWWPLGCNAMDVAAAHGRLDVLKWLHVHRDEKCSTNAMDLAAANGYLEIVQWLHGSREEGCTTKAMDGAVGNGHVHVADWLYRNRSEGCTTDAIDQAAQRGHLDAIKWLYVNELTGGTAEALTNAITRGHWPVANWLHAHFPGLVPVGLDFSTSDVSINFEILLFLHFHFPSELTPHVVRQATIIFSSIYCGTVSDAIVVQWLKENYPDQQPRDRERG
ncbi:putative ankyrin repeat protein [Phytophthora citrophthora]|uniref:Ankyrin repeat protein n=1 Tax=Phytophthora citrophthora TaxID=4793 RepID=A0AAD9G1G3_9STRA|nr:putative ankyrin repeat protein [Phytophthora citrophthora]